MCRLGQQFQVRPCHYPQLTCSLDDIVYERENTIKDVFADRQLGLGLEEQGMQLDMLKEKSTLRTTCVDSRSNKNTLRGAAFSTIKYIYFKRLMYCSLNQPCLLLITFLCNDLALSNTYCQNKTSMIHVMKKGSGKIVSCSESRPWY